MRSLRQSMTAVILTSLVIGGAYLAFQAFQYVQFARAEQKVQATREQLSTVTDLSAVFRMVGKTVEPSVVNIDVRKTIKSPHANMPFGNDDLLRRFFRDQGGDMPELPDMPDSNEDDGGTMEQLGTGSGVIIEAVDGTGYILTNNHVVGKATEIDITLHDGRVFKKARVLGTDTKTDLAVVEVKADRLIPAKWGDSTQLQPGDWVLAFGSPFGYVGSMTHGIVSAVNRTDVGILGRQGYENFIQVDAPINPGNSGGPLVNIRGEVVGINTAIASRSGGFQGIGFAIPSAQAQRIYKQLKEKGKVVRGWLGVGISDVSKNLPTAKSFGYTGEHGVLVEQTFPNTPSTGKLDAGDIITAIDGKPVADVQELRNVVATVTPGSDIKLTVFRNKQTKDVTIKVGEQPEDMAAMVGRGGNRAAPGGKGNTAEAMGMKLTTLTDQLAEHFGLEEVKSGALITSVSRSSLAAQAGLRPGDVIVRVGDQAITSALEAKEALAKSNLNNGIRLYVASREGSRFVFLQQAK